MFFKPIESLTSPIIKVHLNYPNMWCSMQSHFSSQFQLIFRIIFLSLRYANVITLLFEYGFPNTLIKVHLRPSTVITLTLTYQCYN